MFELRDLSIKVKDRYLIKGLNLVLDKGDKLAIIGEEGNGKSTLLKAVLGLCDYALVTGSINTKGNRIGYLEQSMRKEYLDKKVYDYLFVDDNDYYNKVNVLYKYLEVIKLDDNIFEQVISTLSGGEKVKISILKLLLEEYDILFLDEPTNDLDIETLEWLEGFINNTNKPIMYVSHDETLLANTANMILHLEQIMKKTKPRHTLLKIDYDTYVDERIRKINKKTQVAKFEKKEHDKAVEKLNKIMQKVEHEQNAISRGDPHGARLLKKKMHAIKSQEKRLDNKELTEVPDVEESINFFFEDVKIPNSKNIIKVNYPVLEVNNKVLSKNIELEIIGPTHMCIIGQNGVGKSTLLKKIYDELKMRTDINVGYMPQNYDDVLGKYEKVLDFLCPKADKEYVAIVRSYLGNMNFTREEMTGNIKDLSNGTKAKLLLVKLVLDKCDVLVLDEPTRNVSPLSNPVIRKILRDFNGTIISVSHDRKYLNEVIDDIYILTKDGIKKER